ncbi:MFS transporter [Roseateles sp.]|uniref:MFS transporter n=1 Tax=Roseateles sp. TaxID=1971397 RepID=UPI0039ED6026
MTHPTLSVDAPTQLDQLPLTRLHLFVVLLCAVGFTFDLFEIGLGNALSAVFSTPPHAASKAELSSLLSAPYVGAILGAPLFGRLGDKCGRRLALALLLVVLALASALCARSSGIGELTVWRAFAGVGIGGFPPVMIAFLSDVLPPGKRGKLIFLAAGLGAIGPPAAVFVVRWLTPLAPFGYQGWQWAFAIGTVGALGASLLLLLVPESPRWLHAVGRQEEALAAAKRFAASKPLGSGRVSRAAPTSTPTTAPVRQGGTAATLALCMVYFLSPWSTVAFPLLSGAILMGKGFRLDDTLLFVGLSTLAPILGTMLAASVVDRFDRRAALGGCACLMAVSGFCFALADQPAVLVASSLTFLLGASVYLPVLTTSGAELFPTKHRAFGSSGAWALNRMGAAIAPIALLPLLATVGPLGMASLICATLVVTIILFATLPRGLALRSLR